MVNTELLNLKIKESGLKKSQLCKAMGITYQTFRHKRNNASAFTSQEVNTLCELLNISTMAEMKKIFFSQTG
jgi:hypothetical protein